MIAAMLRSVFTAELTLCSLRTAPALRFIAPIVRRRRCESTALSNSLHRGCCYGRWVAQATRLCGGFVLRDFASLGLFLKIAVERNPAVVRVLIGDGFGVEPIDHSVLDGIGEEVIARRAVVSDEVTLHVLIERD